MISIGQVEIASGAAEVLYDVGVEIVWLLGENLGRNILGVTGTWIVRRKPRHGGCECRLSA